MPTTTRPAKRKDPRAASTQAALIETAEALFAEHGIAGVSLRQLGQAIGSANTNVVTYHFGSKDELVEKVIRHRLAIVEARRAELLADLPGNGEAASPAELLDVVFRPFLEQTNAQGKHSYVAFIASLLRSGRMALRSAVSSDYPVTQQLTQRLQQHFELGRERVFAARMESLTQLVFGYLQHIDREGLTGTAAEEHFADCLRVVEAALAAPGD